MLYHQRSCLYSHELKIQQGCIKNCCKPENYKQKFIYLYIYVCILVFANEELLPINLLSRASQETSYVAQMWKEGAWVENSILHWFFYESESDSCNIRRGVLIQKLLKDRVQVKASKLREGSWTSVLACLTGCGTLYPLHSILVATSHRCKGPKRTKWFSYRKKRESNRAKLLSGFTELF